MNFNKKFDTYDENAIVQKKVASLILMMKMQLFRKKLLLI